MATFRAPARMHEMIERRFRPLSSPSPSGVSSGRLEASASRRPRAVVRAAAMDRSACVRDYFGNAHLGLPKALTDLLDHRLSWYRWAGLELLDAWGAPEQAPALIEDRVWDRSALVRTRALRMHHG